MNQYPLVFVQRHPKTHIIQYQLICNGKVVLPTCAYQEGYAEAARLMTPDDTLQEIEGKNKSRKMTYSEMLEGHIIMNGDIIDK